MSDAIPWVLAGAFGVVAILVGIFWWRERRRNPAGGLVRGVAQTNVELVKEKAAGANWEVRELAKADLKREQAKLEEKARNDTRSLADYLRSRGAGRD